MYSAFNHRLAEIPFFNYSAHYWSKHKRLVQNSTSCLALAFLRDQVLIGSAVQAVWRACPILPKAISGLNATARYRLHYLMEKLLIGEDGDPNIGVNVKNSYGRMPLSLAAEGGHEAVFLLLPEREDVKADSKDNDGRTLLLWPAQEGHE